MAAGSTSAWPPWVFTVDAENGGGRLDVVLAARLPGFSRAGARELLRSGRVRVNGAVQRTGGRVQSGAEVRVAGVPPPGTPLPVGNEALPLTLAYADSALLAADKPAGMPTVPLTPSDRETLASALVARYPELRGLGYAPLEAGILQRLDTGTSGLVLVGRTAGAFAWLADQLEAEAIEKTYVALVAGSPPAQGHLDEPIAHDPGRRTRMQVVRDPARARALGARAALTRFRVLERYRGHALVEVGLRTGVRHQVRAHLAAAGFPLVGDALYGGPPGPPGRHFLHASRLALAHPSSGAPLVIRAELAVELVAWLNAMLKIK